MKQLRIFLLWAIPFLTLASLGHGTNSTAGV